MPNSAITNDVVSFWNKKLDELLNDLGTTQTGLTSVEAAHRLSIYGANDTARVARPAIADQLFVRFRNPLVIVLLLASALAAVTGDLASFVIIVVIVVLSVLMDFVQERRAQSAIDTLRKQVALRARVIRDRKEVIVEVSQLVPGDIVQLAAGDLIPADGRLLAAKNLSVNQALLTGEPFPTEKRATDVVDATRSPPNAPNAVFAGTTVVSGAATMVICQTGRATALGSLASTLAETPLPTAFEIGLQRFSILILQVTAVLVVFVLAESMAFQRPWLESLMFALALAVGLTPELLPMIVTVTLARGALRLANRQVIVKRLGAIHNFGAMDVLCTDKTGTLTEAHIKLVRHIDASGCDNARVSQLAYLNSYFETGLRTPLDDAILAHKEIDVSRWRRLDELPFDFLRRRVSMLLEEDNGRRLIVVKGAPESILQLSAHVESVDGGTLPLTPKLYTSLYAQFEQLGTEGYRVLGVASRVVDPDSVKIALSDERNLTFVGFAIFSDPPKASASQAIRTLMQSGVKVKILTGDNERVACRLWKDLEASEAKVITGDELASMSEEALTAMLPEVNLFCRVMPEQKLRIILALKRIGQTVGYLGDGINDAPALHAADVSISVDGAADVAKAAADIVMLNKDLGILQDGVIEGRRTVLNADKYIRMATSANFGNILSMAIAGLILPFLPLLPIQVLLTNLLYDFAQIGLPFDRVDPEAAQRPVHWDLKMIERFMFVMGPVSTLFDLMTFGALVFIFHADEIQFRTGWFVESLVTQLVMIFAVRTQRHLWKSRPHTIVGILALSMSAITIALPYLPVSTWFSFVALPPLYFVFLVAAVIGFLAMVELVKPIADQGLGALLRILVIERR